MSDPVSSKKHNNVTLWLQRIFSSGPQALPVPEFEINNHTVDILHELANYNEKQEFLWQNLINELELQNRQYREREAELDECLSQFDVAFSLPFDMDTTEPLTFSPETVEQNDEYSVQYIASRLGLLAVELNCADVSLSSLLVAMQTLQQNVATLKRIHTERTDTEAKLQKELEQSILWFDSLRNIHNQWSQQCQAQDECDATQSTAQLEALECEVREYDSTCSSLLTTLRQTLQSCGLKDSTADVEWQTLVQRHNEVRQWEAQVHLVERALAPYHSLPPNIVLAKQHLDAAKHELYQLEERLQQSLAYLQLQ
jgi:hypothetical protein